MNIPMRASISLRSSGFIEQFRALRYPWMYVFLITVAELVTCRDIYIGVLFHMCILGALLIHSVMLEDKPVADMLTAMSVAPLIRVLGLSTPLIYFSQAFWFAVVSVPVFITAITIARMQKLKIRQIGLGPPNKKHLPLEILVVFLCVPVGFLEYYLLVPSPLADFNFQSMLTPTLIMIINTGFMEESIFRGLLQYHADRIGGIQGLFLVSVLFGILHLTNLVWIDAFLAGSVGFIFALVIRRTGSIWMMSLAHGVINTVLFMVAPHILD